MSPNDAVRAAALRRLEQEAERLREVIGNLRPDELVGAMSAATGFGMLARIGSLAGSAIAELDPLAPSIARSVEHRRELGERAGGMLTAEEAAVHLGVSRQEIDKRRIARTILAVRDGSRWRYPLCQFRDGAIVAGIDEVVQAFAEAGSWVALDFLLAEDSAIGGRRPIDALAAGDHEDVRRLLRAQAGDGFA